MVRIVLIAVVALFGCEAGGGHFVGTRTDSGVRPGIDGGGGPSGESCGNGIDDDGDGLIDELCACTEGERQPCWPGTLSRRGLGACHDGFQTCGPYGEFVAWGTCDGAQLPTAEVVGNSIDEDCDGDAPGGPMCRASEFGMDVTACTDGVDTDCDGLIDCDDPDCAPHLTCSSRCIPSEFGELCDDRLDNDCDGLADCADDECAMSTACYRPPPDPRCVPAFPFIAEIACSDTRDNDCDGRIDCDDSDCTKPGSCGCPATETSCTNGTDDDCDDDIDCADLDCQICTPGSFRWCDDPVYCNWGKQFCGSDSRWGACNEVTDAPAGCTEGGFYDLSCCIAAGACCQNWPTDDTSVGDCSMIVTCGS